MNTAELPKALAKKVELTKKDAAATQTLLNAIKNVLANSRDYRFLSLIGTRCVNSLHVQDLIRKRVKKYKLQIQ